MLREKVDTEKWNRRIERRKNNPVGMERVLRAIAGRMGQHRAEYLNAADAADKVPGAAPGWETLKHRNKGRENEYKSVVKDMHAMADVWDKAVTTAAKSKSFPKITKAVSDTAPGNEPGTTVRPEHVKGKRDRKGKRSVGPYSVAYTRHRNPIRDDQRSHMADSYDFSDRVFEAINMLNDNLNGSDILEGSRGLKRTERVLGAKIRNAERAGLNPKTMVAKPEGEFFQRGIAFQSRISGRRDPLVPHGGGRVRTPDRVYVSNTYKTPSDVARASAERRRFEPGFDADAKKAAIDRTDAAIRSLSDKITGYRPEVVASRLRGKS